MEIEFKAELWGWQGKGTWYFITLRIEYSDEIKLVGSLPKRSFGLVCVDATIGKTTWKTPVFPDTKSSSYLLPVKKVVRAKEGLRVGDSISVLIRLIESQR